ncbi:MAG TPA: aldolase/citrate lyase family protein [Hyphomicrobiaceae bacterium]|jgi:2-dehydro-3-deoxyglucarate aldolase/4-hydroxy-2-oxoheptanedioate aldolase
MSGQTLLGSMVFEFFTPGIGQVLKLAGSEFIIYDMEHAGCSIAQLKEQCAYCRGLGVAPMVRVPRGEYHFLARALDVGARGVMVPMVDSIDQARAIAEATHYPPQGRRGAAFGFAHDDYAPGDPSAKMRAADACNLIIAQIETERGLEAVEDIAATDGIDCLWLGHFDLTNFLGIPGEFDNPVYLRAVKRMTAAGRAHGKALGYMAADAYSAKAYRALGFNMIATGTDHGILMAGVRHILGGIAD